MSIASTTEWADGKPVITDHATCEGCGAVLDAQFVPPTRTIIKAMAEAKWWSSRRPGGMTLTWCPTCGEAEDLRLNA